MLVVTSLLYPEEAAEDCWTCCVHVALSVGLKVNVLPPSPMSPELEPYCKTACPFWRLPVFPNCKGVTHWLELLPLWVAEKFTEALPVSDSCPTAFVTCAIAGAAIISPKANIAATIINFFNSTSFYLDLNYLTKVHTV
jgi:hypothetical protein